MYGVRWFLGAFGWRIRAEGPARRPDPNHPLVVVSNHTGMLEPFLVAHTVWRQVGRWVQPLAKAEVFKIPVIGTIGRAAGGVPVHREDRAGRADAFSTAVQKLSEGATVWLGPEGTITHDGNLLPLRTGAARLALRGGADVLVVTHVGAQRVFSPVAKMPHRGAIVTMAMDLLTAHPDEDEDTLNGRMAATMMDRMQELEASHPQRDPEQPWWPPYSNPREPSRTARGSLERYKASMAEAVEHARQRMAEYADEHHLDEKVLEARRRAAQVAAEARERARQARAHGPDTSTGGPDAAEPEGGREV